MVSVDNRSNEGKQALSHLKNTIQNKDGRYSVGFFWNGQQKNFQNNYFAALSQLKSLETRLGKDENLKERYSETFKIELKKMYVSNMDTSEDNSNTLWWYPPHNPVLHPNTPQKCDKLAMLQVTSMELL